MRDPRARAVAFFGLLTMAYWASRALFPAPIPPFAPMPELGPLLGDVPPWMRSIEPKLQTVTAETLRTSLMVQVVKAWAFIAAGFASGLLLLLRRRAGRWIALALCAWILAWAVIDRVAMIARHGWEPFLRVWSLLARMYPSFLASTLLEAVFCALTLVFLARRPAASALPLPESDAGRSG
jgi:hypothetical protein